MLNKGSTFLKDEETNKICDTGKDELHFHDHYKETFIGDCIVKKKTW